MNQNVLLFGIWWISQRIRNSVINSGQPCSIWIADPSNLIFQPVKVNLKWDLKPKKQKKKISKRTTRASIISHLNRCWSAGHCSQLVVRRMTSEFNQNVDSIFSDHTCNLFLIYPVYLFPFSTFLQHFIPKPVCFCICLQAMREREKIAQRGKLPRETKKL